MSASDLVKDARKERRFFLSLSLPALVLVGLGAIVPMVWILRQSFLNIGGQATLSNYEKILFSGLTWSALWTTIMLSGATLAICLVLGIPVALTLASARPRIANRMLIFIMLPLWTSILVRTYGWLVLLRRDGLVNSTLGALGITDTPLPLVYNFSGTLVGMVHYMLPLFILPVYAAMRDIDSNIIRASASMGASMWHCVRTVILPLSVGGILSGSTIVFIYTLGFFVTPAVLGGGKVNPVAIRIERTLSTFQDWGSASALGVVLLVLVLTTGAMVFGLRQLTAVRVRNA
ncbi:MULTISPECIES: ABC transporter permease [Agrobacterium]|uniref:ABC transporter permease n=1 Tax=Agrobacterium tumefaciens TaxID=358 RepID=A0AAE6BIS4_AGRTU|nr:MULTISPECIES: ABC transporter permease [Agrobacterium]QCL77200.1 ABC transporter permease [Agrobacterium tumefaciens]QCL82708.1 ABC transporter permease [Agrobacterium tumefaciens]CUX70466.1 ABC transporter permease protein [Agrobacterium sp. NCPPB 925]